MNHPRRPRSPCQRLRAAAAAPHRGRRPGAGDHRDPLGPLTALASPTGLHGLWFDFQEHRARARCGPHDPSQRWIAQAARSSPSTSPARGAASTCPLRPQGTPFQEAVWQAAVRDRLRRHDELRPHRAGARQARRRAVRAARVGRNPISILVPCHRVVGESGALTGYAAACRARSACSSSSGRRARAASSRRCPEGGLRLFVPRFDVIEASAGPGPYSWRPSPSTLNEREIPP
jgi:methylated-DNA-[protein]-cysteine S-methyltransferase